MDQFNLEIISPEKSFLIKKDTIEVIVPAIEGYMGILKDHIPIISFPCSVLLTLSNSSIKIMGFIHFVSISISTILPHVEPTYV